MSDSKPCTCVKKNFEPLFQFSVDYTQNKIILNYCVTHFAVSHATAPDPLL